MKRIVNNYLSILTTPGDIRKYCNNDPVLNSDLATLSVLQSIYPKEKINEKNYLEHKAKLLSDKKQCMKLLSQYRNEEYKQAALDKLNQIKGLITIYNIVPRIYKLPDEEFYIELFLNIFWFLVSIKVSWSDWMLYHPLGQLILKNLFAPKSKKDAIATVLNLALVIKSVVITNGYDGLMFRSEIFKIIPSLDFLTSSDFDPIKTLYIKFIGNMITTKLFIKTIERIFGEDIIKIEEESLF